MALPESRMSRPERRMGVFLIDFEFIRYFPKVVREFFREIDALVVEADYRHDWHAVRYMVYSPTLDVLEENEGAPSFPVHKLHRRVINEGEVRMELVKLTLGKRNEKARDDYESSAD